MLHTNPEQLAATAALPLVTILLFWTVAIFHKNRRRWGPYDIPVVAVLVLSILRNLSVLSYTLITLFGSGFNTTEFCSVVTWLFNSIHTFQASSLTTIAVIGLFSAKLYRKNQNLRTFLTPTHVIYHLFCLTTLCACVGVAAILAQKEPRLQSVFSDNFDFNPCAFLPFELDIKFNVFIIVLHIFLATVSFVCFIVICINYYKTKKHGFSYMKKSSSDLSEISNNYHGINTNVHQENRNFYDTYTIHRSENNNYFGKDSWPQNSEVLSNVSTTVSSTNSRRPCIVKTRKEEEEEEEMRRTGLETIHPVLIVCYMFYHLPIIVFSCQPRLVSPWPVAGVALWLGLVQDILVPVGLGIVDSRFCSWVARVYMCTSKRKDEKLPQVGLDGKFRPFGLSSQPQTLESTQERNRGLQTVEHRFPITNGSLYTSIDGRLPVIHNYRRNNKDGIRTGTGPKPHPTQENQSSNVALALHSSHINRHESTDKDRHYQSCGTCEMDMCPSHSNLHHLSPQYISRQLTFLHKLNQANENNRNMLPKRLSQSQESINHLQYEVNKNQSLFYHRSEMNIPNYNLKANLNNQMIKNSRNLLRINKFRLSRSDDSLSEIRHQELLENSQQHQNASNNYHHQKQPSKSTQYSSDDEAEFFDISVKNYDSMSSNNSITTEANGDFEFFQTSSSRMPLVDSVSRYSDDYRLEMNSRSSIEGLKSHESSILVTQPPQITSTIRRSNSKRSLENFQIYVEENNNRQTTLRRSNSYSMALEDRDTLRNHVPIHQSEEFKQKMKSAEFLPKNISTVYIEDLRNNNKFVNSEPDFKKIFISEYI